MGSVPMQCAPTRQVCKYFAKGYCSRGNTCNFLHEMTPNNSIHIPNVARSQQTYSAPSVPKEKPTIEAIRARAAKAKEVATPTLSSFVTAKLDNDVNEAQNKLEQVNITNANPPENLSLKVLSESTNGHAPLQSTPLKSNCIKSESSLHSDVATIESDKNQRIDWSPGKLPTDSSDATNSSYHSTLQVANERPNVSLQGNRAESVHATTKNESAVSAAKYDATKAGVKPASSSLLSAASAYGTKVTSSLRQNLASEITSEQSVRSSTNMNTSAAESQKEATPLTEHHTTPLEEAKDSGPGSSLLAAIGSKTATPMKVSSLSQEKSVSTTLQCATLSDTSAQSQPKREPTKMSSLQAATKPATVPPASVSSSLAAALHSSNAARSSSSMKKISSLQAAAESKYDSLSNSMPSLTLAAKKSSLAKAALPKSVAPQSSVTCTPIKSPLSARSTTGTSSLVAAIRSSSVTEKPPPQQRPNNASLAAVASNSTMPSAKGSNLSRVSGVTNGSAPTKAGQLESGQVKNSQSSLSVAASRSIQQKMPAVLTNPVTVSLPIETSKPVSTHAPKKEDTQPSTSLSAKSSGHPTPTPYHPKSFLAACVQESSKPDSSLPEQHSSLQKTKLQGSTQTLKQTSSSLSTAAWKKATNAETTPPMRSSLAAAASSRTNPKPSSLQSASQSFTNAMCTPAATKSSLAVASNHVPSREHFEPAPSKPFTGQVSSLKAVFESRSSNSASQSQCSWAARAQTKPYAQASTAKKITSPQLPSGLDNDLPIRNVPATSYAAALNRKSSLQRQQENHKQDLPVHDKASESDHRASPISNNPDSELKSLLGISGASSLAKLSPTSSAKPKEKKRWGDESDSDSD